MSNDFIGRKSNLLTSIQIIGQVFFPMIRHSHYYCVVFNLKTNAVDILDNMGYDGDMEDIYDYDVYILVQFKLFTIAVKKIDRHI